MLSRYEMSNLQEIRTSRSSFRDDENVDVVNQMHDVADQMGDDMSIGLGGNFEYQEAKVREQDEGVGCSGLVDEESFGDSETEDERVVADVNVAGGWGRVVEADLGVGVPEG